MNLNSLSNAHFAPALGWPAGIAITAIMIGFAIAVVIVHARSKGHSDETLGACIRRCAICLVIATLALTPSTITSTVSRAVNTTDIIIATDVTGSMAVNDAHYGSQHTLTRLDAAKKAVDDLTNIYENSSFAAVRFGASATLDVPLTPDTGAIRSWADGLRPEPTSVSAGSSLDSPIDPLLVTLKSIRESYPEDRIILYYISDGEQTDTKSRRTFSSLRQYLDDAFTIAVGSPEGSQIPEIESSPDAPLSLSNSGASTSENWVIDPSTGQPGISRMNIDNLKAIADEMSGKSIVLDTTHQLTKQSVASASRQFRSIETPKRRDRVTPVVWPLSIILTILLTMELAAWLSSTRRLL